MKNNSRKKNNNIHYKLPESVIGFLNYLETIKNKSRNTIDGYRVDLTTFFRFMMIHRKRVRKNIEFEDIDISGIDNDFIRSITLSDMYSFLSFCQNERDNGASARARKVYCLKSYFNYMYKKDKIINENIAEELEKPQISKNKPITLNLNQSIKLLDAVDKEARNSKRDYCIITLFLQCGLRLSELCNIKLNDIKDNKIRITGKGSKQRDIHLNQSCLKAIRQYLADRKEDNADNENIEYLFLSERQQKISKSTVEVIVKKHLKSANLVDKKYSAHKLRGTYATLNYNAGAKARAIQIALGHSSISTTQLYLSVEEDELRDMAEMNPLNNL